jgi:tRNA pseudouridine32 synthase/23S rRNA pseudouridine746 synthase/23S rRNA pseudouridine1911/1915/1917 synthase
VAERVSPPDILYRDGLVLIVDKPAGVAVHAGPSGGPSLEDAFDALRFGLPKPPALAHRLDRDTSGCLVLGRHPKALRRLGKLFADGRVRKTYWAVVRGEPPAETGRIDFPLAKISSKAGGWRMVADAETGQPAVTGYRLMGRGPDGTSWLELTPKTGRTHQIRVHCAQSGFPILGDPWYGAPQDRDPKSTLPLHLHARAVTLPLYPKKPPIRSEAPVPPSLLPAFAACGFS